MLENVTRGLQSTNQNALGVINLKRTSMLHATNAATKLIYCGGNSHRLKRKEKLIKRTYVPKAFYGKSLQRIALIEEICQRYAAMGYDLTVRQCYYQLVAGGHIDNDFKTYKSIASLINDARLAGLLDWNYIVDRTRNLAALPHWNSPSDIIGSAYESYCRDKWADQSYHVEIWVEKEALIGVIERVANELDCPYFACRGYVSQSEMRDAALRFIRYRQQGKQGRIIHLGDHDPSGIHMTQDIQDRFNMFGASTVVQRVALTMEQVEELNPPENPAKETDARFADYVIEYGESSWELDAIDPVTMHAIIRDAIEPYIDREKWDATVQRQNEEKAVLKVCSDEWEAVELHITDEHAEAYEAALAELSATSADEEADEEEE